MINLQQQKVQDLYTKGLNYFHLGYFKLELITAEQDS